MNNMICGTTGKVYGRVEFNTIVCDYEGFPES